MLASLAAAWRCAARPLIKYSWCLAGGLAPGSRGLAVTRAEAGDVHNRRTVQVPQPDEALGQVGQFSWLPIRPLVKDQKTDGWRSHLTPPHYLDGKLQNVSGLVHVRLETRIRRCPYNRHKAGYWPKGRYTQTYDTQLCRSAKKSKVNCGARVVNLPKLAVPASYIHVSSDMPSSSTTRHT